ncbi:MAG: hypothetical protein Kow00129_01500 [Thermoleophilia bacterium]
MVAGFGLLFAAPAADPEPATGGELAAAGTREATGDAENGLRADTLPPDADSPPAGAAGADPAATASPAEGSEPALVIGPDGEPEPYWRAKQREARAAALAATTTTDPNTSTTDGEQQLGTAGISGDGTSGGGTSGGGTSTTLPAGTGDTRQVLTGGQTPLAGLWAGTSKELARYLLAGNPAPRFTVDVERLAGYYVKYAAEVGLRADVLWAQMLHETGFGKYGGDVEPEQNNFAGLGATGGGNPGHSFATAELGVKAHVAHLAAYVFATDPAPWTNAQTDPRYELVNPRGQAKVLSDLDGRWAVPGDGYGERIEKHVRALNR